MFTKTARARLLGCWEGEDTSNGFQRSASFYQQNAGKLDLEAALHDVAAVYAIDPDPGRYMFLPVRANSCDVPNENGDCFTKDEMLRFDAHLGRKVYQSYLLKPHHINHRADNPRMARGFILDCHYNDAGPMPQRWRDKYEASTGKSQPRDRYIEALIAVDTTKDPYLTKGYRSGAIRTFSMGCDCERTRCSVCGNIASSRREFCSHIAKGKKRLFAHPTQPGRTIMAYEECQGVVFGELSAVDEPADPRADVQGDILRVNASKLADDDEVRAYLRAHANNLPREILAALQKKLA